MKFTGAIFDMDGLLFDTEQIFQETWAELAEARHIRLKDDFPRAISGTNGAYMCRVIEKYYQVADGSFIMNECMDTVRRKLEFHVPVKKGVPEILEYFRKEGFRVAVASSSSTEQIMANLKNADLTEYFDEIVSGKDVKNGKPAPDIFEYAAEKIGCRPQECYVFEDSENGIRAGHAAGCAAVMIPDLFQPSPEVRTLCTGIYSDLMQAMEEIQKSGEQ